MQRTPASNQKNIKISDITETTYCDGTAWVEYLVDDKYGYEITEKEYPTDNDPAALNEWPMEQLVNKPHVSTCSEYLCELVKNTLGSQNEMWFVEKEDLDPNEMDKIIEDLEKEVEKLGLESYVTFWEDDCPITVFGGVITKFLF